MKVFRVLPKDSDFFDIEADRIDVDSKTGFVVFSNDSEVFPVGAVSLSEVVGVFEVSSIKE